MMLLCLAFALFPSLFAWLRRALAARASAARRCCWRPFAWVATEILRAHTFFRFSWCLLGYSQHANAARSSRSRASRRVYGVSFLVAVVVARSSPTSRLETRPAAARAAALGVAGRAAGRGLARTARGRLAQPIADDRAHPGGPRAGRIRQDEKWDPAQAWTQHRPPPRRSPQQAARAGRAARGLAGVGGALPLRPQPEPSPRSSATWRAQRGIHLLFGNDDRERGARRATALFVGAKMLDPDRRPGPALPQDPPGARSASTCRCSRCSRWAGASRPSSCEQVADFTPGHGARRRRRSTATASGASICYEAIFPDLVRQLRGGRRGAAGQHHERRLVRTHLGAPPAPGHGRVPRGGERQVPGARRQHRHHRGRRPARPRAGAHARCSSRRVLVRDVPFVPGTTFYARHGDVFAWALLRRAWPAAALLERADLGRVRIE